MSRLRSDPAEADRLQQLLDESVSLGQQLRDMVAALGEFTDELVGLDAAAGLDGGGDASG